MKSANINTIKKFQQIATVDLSNAIYEWLNLPQPFSLWIHDESNYPVVLPENLPCTLVDTIDVVNESSLTTIMDMRNTGRVQHRSNALLLGLQIIDKYLPGEDVAAEHDLIYGCSIESLIEANLTVADALKLSLLGWHISDESLGLWV